MKAVGACVAENRSFLQKYHFDPSQECKLDMGDRVMFTHNLDLSCGVSAIDLDRGELTLKIGKKSLNDKCKGAFPGQGSLLKNEYIAPGEIPGALSDIGGDQLSNCLVSSIKSFLERVAPRNLVQNAGETPLDGALRIIKSMSGECLVIQGPPGTGKTYTASCMIETLLVAGKKVGIASNSHKAVTNLLCACGEAAQRNCRKLVGIKVGDEPDDAFHKANPGVVHIRETSAARAAYTSGVVGGTAWLFSRPEWKNALDFLFIDEAGP